VKALHSALASVGGASPLETVQDVAMRRASIGGGDNCRFTCGIL
jgi:hypothetical protein